MMVSREDRLWNNRRYRQLWAEVDRLSNAVESAGGRVPRAVLDAFAAYEKSQLPDDAMPPIGVLKSARSAFYAMPATLQREVLSGWEPAAKLRSRGDVLKMQEDDHVNRVLYLNVYQSHGSPLNVSACITDELHRDGDAVAICVAHGTPKQVVLDGLAMAMGLLDAKWADAMRGDYIAGELVNVTDRDGQRRQGVGIRSQSPSFFTKEKSGMPDSPLASKLGSNSERAESTAAA